MIVNAFKREVQTLQSYGKTVQPVSVSGHFSTSYIFQNVPFQASKAIFWYWQMI
jgi:hypothetical protein